MVDYIWSTISLGRKRKSKMSGNKNGKKKSDGVETKATSGQRVIIVRGPLGEVVIDSSNDEDTLESMARLARDQYEKGPPVPGYIN